MNQKSTQQTASNAATATNEFEDRKRKLNELKEMGVLPYIERFERTHKVSDLRKLAEGGNAPRTSNTPPSTSTNNCAMVQNGATQAWVAPTQASTGINAN